MADKINGTTVPAALQVVFKYANWSEVTSHPVGVPITLAHSLSNLSNHTHSSSVQLRALSRLT